jgi:pilus assembly protein CpaB
MALSAPVPNAPASGRPASRRALFVVGIAMSVLAFLLVIVVGLIVAGRAGAGVARVNLVVAARNISQRTTLARSDLTLASLPATAVPPGALPAASLATGKVTQVDVLKGQPVTSNLVAAPPNGNPAYLPIPQGWLAYTLPAGAGPPVGGYVIPGDVIDIAATVSSASGIAVTGSVTKLVLPGVRVIRVGPPGQSSQQSSSGATSLTVLITPCDLPYLVWFLNQGSNAVSYTLHSSSDYGAAPTGPSASCPLGSTPVEANPTTVDKKFGFTKS